MNPLFTLLFGFVCHPFLILAVVLTQLLWSMWIYNADLDAPPLWLHMQVGALACAVFVVSLRSQCRKRDALRYHSSWAICGGRLFQGQLRLGMQWWKQLVCGTSIGILVSLIDESELLATLLLSPSFLGELRREYGSRAGVPHMAHAHDTMLLVFVMHGWFWTLVTAGTLGAWTNAARLHSAEPIMTID